MRVLVGLILVVILFFAAAVLYRHPKVQSFCSSPNQQEHPLAFLENLPELAPKPDVIPREKRTDNSTPKSQFDPEETASELPEFQNQVPNEKLARVLMQILAARKLAEGLSLQVTDDTVQLFGEVPGAEQRRQILEIIEKAREARRVDDDYLKVRDSGN